MLRILRENSPTWLVYAIFGGLVFVFAVNFGPGSGSCQRGQMAGVDYAAVVNGDVIRRQEFASILAAQVEYLRRSGAYGGQLDPEMLERLGLRRQVIDQLVETKLLEQEAARYGLSVTDADLLKHLQTRYGVSEVGFADYEAWVNRTFQTSVHRFEEQVRGTILAEKVARLVRDTVSISDDELRDAYVREHNRSKVLVVKLDPRDEQSAEPSAAAIDKVLAEDNASVLAHYNDQVFKYRTPLQVRARQIMKKLPADATEADIAKARGALVDLKGQIEAGADFAALAQAHSEDDATKAKGGDMGLIKREHLAKPLADAIFALKTNDFTGEPVKTPQGLHLVQATEITPPERIEFAEVQRDVAKELLASRAQESGALRKAETLLGELRSGKAFESLTMSQSEEQDASKAAEDKGETFKAALPVRAESPWILANDSAIAGIGQNPELHAEIFALTAEAPYISKPYKVGRYVYIVKLAERETADMSKFDGEKESLRDQALLEKRDKVFRAWTEHLRKRASVELNPELFGQQGGAS